MGKMRPSHCNTVPAVAVEQLHHSVEIAQTCMKDHESLWSHDEYLLVSGLVQMIQPTFEADAPVSGGSMGWAGDSGMYVPRSILDAGEANGEAMEYYKSYNARVMAE